MAGSFALSLAAVDVLAQLLAIDPRRYPFEIPSVGDRGEDRTRIARAVFADLAGRGLVGEDGVAARVRKALRAVSCPDVAVAVSGSPEAGSLLRARGVTVGGYAVVAVQEGQHVRFTPVEPPALARTLVDLLPDVCAGPGQSVRVEQTPEPVAVGITEPVRATRTPAQTDLRIARDLLARPRTGFGFFAVTRAGSDLGALGWLDTDAGRYLSLTRPSPDNAVRVTYSPADSARLTQQLAVLIDS